MAGNKTVYNSTPLECALEILWRIYGLKFDPVYVDYTINVLDGQNCELVVTARPVGTNGRPGIYRGVRRFTFAKYDLTNAIPWDVVYDGPYPVTFGELKRYLAAAYDLYLEDGEFELQGVAGALTEASPITLLLPADKRITLVATAASKRWVEGSEISIAVVQDLLLTPLPAITIDGTLPVGGEGDYYRHELDLSGGNGIYSNARFIGPVPPSFSLQLLGNKLRVDGEPSSQGTIEFELAVDSGIDIFKVTGQRRFSLEIGPTQILYDSRLQFKAPAGASEIIDNAGHLWTAYGAAQIVDQPLMPNGKALSLPADNDYIVTDDPVLDLSGVPFTIDFHLIATARPSSGTELTILQYGQGNEGAGGFHLGCFWGWGGDPLILRNSYSNLVATDVAAFQYGIRQHLAVVGDGAGTIWVCLEGQHWSGPLSVGNTIVPQRLYVHKGVGSWKVSRNIQISDLMTEIGTMKYTPNTTFAVPLRP